MKQKVIALLHTLKAFYLDHKKAIISVAALIILAPIILVIVCHLIISPNSRYILKSDHTKHFHVGLVLGAGVTKDGKPYRELQARLDIAAQALNDGQVDKLLLSGDNRFKRYNEPDAMKNYLINVKHISASKLQADYAGRSTYESCERAAKIFSLKQTIIYSAGSHLPRAIYLCRQFGIESYGVSSGVEANNSRRRELVADVKAIFNVYIYGEHTILGKPITM